VSVTVVLAGAALTPTSPPQLALLPASAEGNPAEEDWRDGEWSGPTARLMIGPGSGIETLTPGSYAVWLRFTAGAEIPVRRTGYIRVL